MCAGGVLELDDVMESRKVIYERVTDREVWDESRRVVFRERLEAWRTCRWPEGLLATMAWRRLSETTKEPLSCTLGRGCQCVRLGTRSVGRLG